MPVNFTETIKFYILFSKTPLTWNFLGHSYCFWSATSVMKTRFSETTSGTLHTGLIFLFFSWKLNLLFKFTPLSYVWKLRIWNLNWELYFMLPERKWVVFYFPALKYEAFSAILLFESTLGILNFDEISFRYSYFWYFVYVIFYFWFRTSNTCIETNSDQSRRR